MKTTIFFATMMIALVSEAQIKASFQNTNTVNFQNTDNVYSYSVRIKRKNETLREYILAPQQTASFTSKFKRKRGVKKFSYEFVYDNAAKQNDQTLYLNESNRLKFLAENIEQSCITRVRGQRGVELSIEGTLLGELRLVGALYRILSSKGMSKEELLSEIEALLKQAEYETSERKKLWLMALLRYYKELYDAHDWQKKCPDLISEQAEYLRKAQKFQESVVMFDKKYETERYRSVSKYNLWRTAANRHVFTTQFTGFGIEFRPSFNSAFLQNAEDYRQPVNAALVKQTKPQYEVKFNVPLTRPFYGILWNMPARLYIPIGVGQASHAFAPSNGSFLGIKNTVGDGTLTHLVGENSSLGSSYNYGTVGLRYQFMPDGYNGPMWLSWEFGAMTVFNNNTISNGSYLKIDSNNKIVSAQAPNNQGTKLFSNNGQIAPYFKIQFSFALFSLANRNNYPDRKKVVFGFSAGIADMTNWNKNAASQLLEVKQSNNKITTTPIKITSGASVSYGLYMYL